MSKMLIFEGIDALPAYFGPIQACKHEAGWLAIHDVKAILKQSLAKRIDLSQAAGVNEDFAGAITVFSNNVEELISRGAVEITCQFKVHVAAVFVNKDLEIGCHDCPSLDCAKLE